MEKKEILSQFRFHVRSVICRLDTLTDSEKLFLLQIIECIFTIRIINLTKFADVLKEKINRLSVVCRLSEHLKTFDFDKIEVPIMEWLERYLPKNEVILMIDKSDYINFSQQKSEDSTYIPNGSHNYATDKKGYLNSNIAALTKDNQPVMLTSKMTNLTKTTQRENEYQCIDTVDKTLQAFLRVYLGDSGYDNLKMIDHLFENGDEFIYIISINILLYIRKKCHYIYIIFFIISIMIIY